MLDVYLAAVNDGEWEPLRARCANDSLVEPLRDAIRSWRDYHERPLQLADTGAGLAVRTHFTGTSAEGIAVEIEPMTVLHLDGDRITGISSWHGDAQPAVAVIGEYFRSSNAEDWGAFAATWSENAELVAVGGPQRHGRDDIVRAYRLFLGLFGSHEDRIERLLVNGRSATVLGTFYGANPQGVAIEFPWMDLVELDEGERAIGRLWHWHDRDRFRKLMAADA